MDAYELWRQQQMAAAKQEDPFRMKFGNMPDDPTYESLLDASGNLKSGFTLNAQPDGDLQSILGDIRNNLSTDTLSQIKSRATSQGPSQSANYLLDRQGLEQQSALDQLIKGGAGAAATARGTMARSGGLTAGARERMARKAQMADFTGRQGLSRQGQADRLGILANDESQKLDLLKMLPGAETQRAAGFGNLANLNMQDRNYRTDIDKTNISNRLLNAKGQNDYNLKMYEERMKGYAANRTADATENAGKK